MTETNNIYTIEQLNAIMDHYIKFLGDKEATLLGDDNSVEANNYYWAAKAIRVLKKDLNERCK